MEENIFGKRLKTIRQQNKLKQGEFVEGLSVSAAALSKYENGNGYPAVATLIEIAKKYKVSVDWLLGLSENCHIQIEKQTYADIIKFLVEIPKTAIETVVNPAKYYIDDCSGDRIRVSLCGISFMTECEEFEEFFNDFNKMNDLYKKGFIDEDVYNLWIEKTIKNLNIAEDLKDEPVVEC